MEVPSTVQTPLHSAREGLDTFSTETTASLEQRDHHLRPLLEVPQQPIFKQRDHRRLPPLKIPRQSNRFPLQLLYPETKDHLSPLSTTLPQTTYRHCSGEVYKSAQAPVPQPEKLKQSRSTISDSKFLQLIRSTASSDEDLSWSGDRSPASSDSSAITIRENLPTYVFETIQESTEFLQIHRLSLNWTTATMLSTLKEKQWGDPTPPAKYGLHSTFREKFSVDANAPKLGQKALDDGFDVAIFMLSTRIYGSNRKHLSGFIPYKLRASQSVALEYSSANAVSVRRKVAWIKLCTALDPRSANERASREFEEVSADFFSGRPVEAEYGDGYAIFGTAPKPYSLSFKNGDRTKVLEEQPLANNSLAIFLEDLIMANEMEEARVKNRTYQNGLRVYRHQSHMEAYTNLQSARKEQEKHTYHDLTKGNNSEMTPEFQKLIMEVSTNIPEQQISVLEFTGGGAPASVSEYKGAQSPDAPEDISVMNNVSSGKLSTIEGASTTISATSTASPMSLAATTSNESANGNAPEILPKSSKVQDYVDSLQATSKNDEFIVAEVKSTNSTPKVETSSTKNSKRGSKRKAAKKGKGVKKTEERLSAQVNHDPDCADVEPEQFFETHPHLSIEAEPEERTYTQPDCQYSAMPDHDSKWNEVKSKVSQKPRNSKKEAVPAPAKTSHEAPSFVRVETSNAREFKPEEYPALSLNVPTTNPAEDDINDINGVSAASVSVAKLPAIPNMSWEETVRNLPLLEADAFQTLTQNSQKSDESITGIGKHPGENSGEAPNIRSTGLEWAAAELTSATKFRSSWRHSSLPYRSTTPGQDDSHQSAEISTTRRRSNTTAILDPRVRAVQFGDFPVVLQESAESVSVANSGHSDSPSHSISKAASTYDAQLPELSNAPIFTNNFQQHLGVSTIPVIAQVPMYQPHHAPPIFMPPYLPPGILPPGLGHHAGFSNPHAAPYGLPIPPGFAHPAPPMPSNIFGYIANRARLVPVAYEYPPNINAGSGVPIQNHQPIDQASQHDGEHDESFSGQSRSDESFDSSPNNNQQPEQLTNVQGPTAIAGYTCSCCHKGFVPCLQWPLYFCGGCGPTCAIRYCSAACLLADAYHHTHHCSQYAHYMRVDPHNMPSDIYEYERFYLAPCELRTEKETPERFRQRQFAMYCWHGPFPQILRAWAEQHELPVGLTGCDINESFKKTGDYHIFRSEVSADGKKFAPCEVICTLRLRNGDPMKEALNRALNACLIFLQPRVVKFLFRLIRHLIVDLDNWSLMMPVLDQRTIYAEFIHQFSLEFSFDVETQVNNFAKFDLTEEWRLIRLDMEDLEMQFQVLRCWYRAKSQCITLPLEPRE